jgi:hypothetical protein
MWPALQNIAAAAASSQEPIETRFLSNNWRWDGLSSSTGGSDKATSSIPAGEATTFHPDKALLDFFGPDFRFTVNVTDKDTASVDDDKTIQTLSLNALTDIQTYLKQLNRPNFDISHAEDSSQVDSKQRYYVTKEVEKDGETYLVDHVLTAPVDDDKAVQANKIQLLT